ncbi:hypothetical protein ACIOWI_36685 [Streptomyces sp. NPDC087659]|uniref:hypothetical protein n=1 Tax=Streptomyces sp. NPDC087659 TaxID=3365801 RepID=UPI00381064E2
MVRTKRLAALAVLPAALAIGFAATPASAAPFGAVAFTGASGSGTATDVVATAVCTDVGSTTLSARTNTDAGVSTEWFTNQGNCLNDNNGVTIAPSGSPTDFGGTSRPWFRIAV